VKWACISVGVMVIGLSMAGSAVACTCAVQPPRERLAQADAAIYGIVVGKHRVPASLDEHGAFAYTISVRRVFKGHPGRRVKLRIPTSDSICGFTMRRHHHAGLLLFGRPGAFHASLCRIISLRDLQRATEDRGRGDAARAGSLSSCL
jgi:hypothetical protein